MSLDRPPSILEQLFSLDAKAAAWKLYQGCRTDGEKALRRQRLERVLEATGEPGFSKLEAQLTWMDRPDRPSLVEAIEVGGLSATRALHLFERRGPVALARWLTLWNAHRRSPGTFVSDVEFLRRCDALRGFSRTFRGDLLKRGRAGKPEISGLEAWPFSNCQSVYPVGATVVLGDESNGYVVGRALSRSQRKLLAECRPALLDLRDFVLEEIQNHWGRATGLHTTRAFLRALAVEPRLHRSLRELAGVEGQLRTEAGGVTGNLLELVGGLGGTGELLAICLFADTEISTRYFNEAAHLIPRLHEGLPEFYGAASKMTRLGRLRVETLCKKRQRFVTVWRRNSSIASPLLRRLLGVSDVAQVLGPVDAVRFGASFRVESSRVRGSANQRQQSFLQSRSLPRTERVFVRCLIDPETEYVPAGTIIEALHKAGFVRVRHVTVFKNRLVGKKWDIRSAKEERGTRPQAAKGKGYRLVSPPIS